jgi:hypothetical protein
MFKQDTHCTYRRNIEARSRNHSYSGKAVCMSYSECMSVALVTQHAKRMRRIILSSVACLAQPYFSTLSHKRHDFRKNVIERKMCVLVFCTTFFYETFRILGRIQRDVTINVRRPSRKLFVILVRF